MPDSTPLLSDGDVTVYTDEQNASVFKGKTSLEAMLSAHLSRIQSGDYFAINAYVERTDAVHAIFHRIRTNIRATTQVATTLGYDPRFLHSVGQLHKGGPNPGVFIQVIGDAQEDLSIPGEPYSFGVLKAAQTLGDMQRQTSRHRRVIRLYLWADVEKALACREQLIAPSMGLHAH